jgi:hypothetical protein
MYSANCTGSRSSPSSWRIAAIVSALASAGDDHRRIGQNDLKKAETRKRTPSRAGNEISKRWTICLAMRRLWTRSTKE